MAIQFPEPPEESRAVLRNTLTRIASSPAGGMAMPQGIRAEALIRSEPSKPHETYSLGLNDLTTGKGIDDAKRTGWRYFINAEAPTVAAAEINIAPSGDAHKFAELNGGPIGANTLSMLQDLENDSRLAAGSYEVRLLRIPALYVSSIWLKNEAQQPDVFVPVAPTNPILVPGQFYSRAQFEDLLRKAAKEKVPSPGSSGS